MMKPSFERRIDSAQELLDALRQYADLEPALGGPLRQALDGLTITLEELQVAQEELRQQNEELVAAHQAVEAERMRYQALFDLAPDGYLVTDPDGTIREANRAAMAVLNVPREFVIGKPLTVFVQDQDRTALGDLISRLGSGKETPGEEWELSFQPSVRAAVPVALTASPVHDPDGRVTGMRWLVRDLTAAKRAEERERLLAQMAQDRQGIEELARDLERERGILQTIMENTHAQLAYLDPDFNFVRVNAAYAQASGYSEAELIGLNHFSLFPHAENEAIFEGVRDIGQPVRYQARPFEYVDRPEQGTTYWDWTLVPVTDAKGGVQGLVLSLLDVTEAERARQERERYLAGLNRLIEATQGILAERTAEGVLQHTVEAARELTQANIGVAGHAFEGAVFRVEVASQSGTLPPCPPAETFGVQKGGVYLDLLQDKESIRLTDEQLKSHPAWWGLPEEHTPLRGLLGARLVAGDGQPSGFIMASHKEQGDFTAEDEALLVQLAALASLGLQHIEARNDAEQRAEELITVLGAMTDAVVVYDTAGTVVQTNPAAARAYGRDPAEAGGSMVFAERRRPVAGQAAGGAGGGIPVHRLTKRYPNGQPVIGDELPSVRSLRGERVENELYSLTTVSGEERTVLVSAAPLVAGDQVSGAVLVWHDVTERERLLEENRRQREFLERLMEAAPVGIAVVRGADHRYEFVNPYYQAIPGVPDVPMAGRTIEEVFPEVVATGVLESVEGVYRTGEPVSLREFEAAVGSGQEQTYWNVDHVPLWDNGSVDGVLILASEVTAEVQARQEAERLAARDQAILTSMTEGVVVFDLAGNVLSMNPAALRIHGFERLEEAQRHLLEFPDMFEIHDLEGRPVAVEQWPLARVLAGERFSGLEVQVRRTDTGQSWIGSYGGTPVLDKEARPFLGVLTLHDVTAQKRIEAAREQLLDELDTGRARLAAIIANAPEAIVVTDPSSRIVQANPASEHLFARPIEDGQRLGDSAGLSLYHPDGTPYQPEELPLSRSALDGETHADLEMLLYRPGGERRDLLVSTAPILDSQGRIDGVVGILQDITERRRTEEALRRYAERLQTLHSVDYAILTAESPEAIAKIALTHLRRAVPCMRASVALFDLKASEVFLLAAMAGGETPLAVGWRGPLTGEWPAEQLERGEICVVEDISTIQPPTPLYQTLLAEGVRSIVHLPLIAEGRLIGSLNLGMPTPGGPTPEEIETAREMAYGLSVSIRQSQLHAEVQRHADELEELVARRTAALQASQARLQAIYDSTSIGITLEDVEGRILDANPALQAMLGYDKGELQRMVFADFTHPEDVTISMEHFRELMAGKRQDYRLEKRYIRKDGQVIWANLTVSRTAGDEGEPQYAVGLVEDITERKLMQDALLNAEKLAIAGRMGASLAHEINNPLQSVIGCLGLAEKNLAEGGDASRYLGVARQELRRAARIVSQLRDMSRLSREEKKVVVDVNALVDEVLVLSRKQAQEHRVEVVWEPAKDLPSVQAEPDRIRQVFLNLTLNAFDAMPEGGQLRVRTARTGQPAGVRIAFADTGIGMTSDALSKLFDPFYTTKSQGLGLGLYISRNIVEEQGGHIEATSRIGEGTTFTVWLPA